MVKVIIAGGRDFNDYELLKSSCDKILEDLIDVEIVSGGARGADSLGEKYAIERGLPIKIFKADWAKHGKSSGFKRNIEMAEYADMLICFWDGESKGTRHMINTAHKYNIPTTTVSYAD